MRTNKVRFMYFRNLLLATILAVSFTLCAPAQEAFASSYTLDGDLGDWGVTPFSNWVPAGADIDYVVENNYNRTWSDAFSEGWDIEAMYFDDDLSNLYFAIVSSNPYNNGWAHESLFFDFSGRSSDEILLNETNGYKYAADLCPVPVDSLSTRGIYKVNQSTVFEENHHNGAPYHFPVSVTLNGVSDDTYLGSYDVFNKGLGKIEYPKGYYDTYVLEGRISKTLFPGECTQPIELYYSKVTCIKDWITLNGDKDNPCVPEPATMVLFGIGGLAAALIKRRRMS